LLRAFAGRDMIEQIRIEAFDKNINPGEQEVIMGRVPP